MGKFRFQILFWAVFGLFIPRVQAAAVAVIGHGEITEQDIADWQAAQSCYGEDAITSRKAGFMRLFEASILDQLLIRQGRPITGDDYKKEVARIDAETRAPDILNCIKKYFGDGTARYERVFVRPILAQRFIRELVKSGPKVQVKAYGLRDGTLKDIAAGKIFRDIGVARGIAYSTAAYSMEEDTSAPASIEPWKRWSPFEASFIEENLKGLKPGEVKPGPIEDELTVKFVRLISVTDKKYYFESLTVPKLSTEDYLKSVPKLSCRINDTELRDWAAPIKGNPILAPAEIEAASEHSEK